VPVEVEGKLSEIHDFRLDFPLSAMPLPSYPSCSPALSSPSPSSCSSGFWGFFLGFFFFLVFFETPSAAT
jgi:hypothetical protein